MAETDDRSSLDGDPGLAAVAARHRELVTALDRLDEATWLLDPSDARDRLEAAAVAIRATVDDFDDTLTAVAAGLTLPPTTHGGCGRRHRPGTPCPDDEGPS